MKVGIIFWCFTCYYPCRGQFVESCRSAVTLSFCNHISIKFEDRLLIVLVLVVIQVYSSPHREEL